MTKRSVSRATTLDRLVRAVFGRSQLSPIVYTLVALSGAFLLSTTLQES